MLVTFLQPANSPCHMQELYHQLLVPNKLLGDFSCMLFGGTVDYLNIKHARDYNEKSS